MIEVWGYKKEIISLRNFPKFNPEFLFQLSYEFCRDFVNEIKGMTSANFGSTNFLCDCLDKMTLNSRDGDIYHRYLLNYRAALTYLESLRNTVEEYAGYEKVWENIHKLCVYVETYQNTIYS